MQREHECESGAWTDQKRVTERMVAVDWNQIMESASMKRLLLSDGPSVGYVFRRNAAVIYALFQYYAVVGGQVRRCTALIVNTKCHVKCRFNCFALCLIEGHRGPRRAMCWAASVSL